MDTNGQLKLNDFGVGWTFLPIFSKRDLKEVAEGTTTETAPLFKGTPRALLIIEGALGIKKIHK